MQFSRVMRGRIMAILTTAMTLITFRMTATARAAMTGAPAMITVSMTRVPRTTTGLIPCRVIILGMWRMTALTIKTVTIP
jgi:hypothetical protein